MNPTWNVFVLALFCLLRVKSLPVKRENPMGTKGIPSAKAFDFMKKYGYIEDGGGASEALFTEKGLEEVIRSIQKFGAIPQTGKLDNATLNLMVSPRCGVPDIVREKSRRKRFILGPTSWNKRNLTFFVANWPGTLSEEEVAKYITLALTTWGRYGRLNFRRVYDQNADIIVAFGSGYHGDQFPFDGPGNVLAHAFFPGEKNGIDGDIHFDNDEKWITDPNAENGVDFYSVAVHELGHSLGLSHSSVPSSVMFPYYTGNFAEGSTLDYDDILGMYELYIKRRLKDDDDNYIPQIPTRSPPTTTYLPRTNPPRTLPPRTNPPRTTSNPPRRKTTKYPATTTQYPRTRPTTPPHDHGVNYDGDSESVDEHKSHDPRHNVPTTTPASFPDICEGNYDAVSTFRNEIYFFKDEYIWRLRKPNDVIPGYPILLRQMFPKFPKTIKKIDAVYERPDYKIVLFTGNEYWVYDGTNFIENSPRPLTHHGFPNYLQKVDAVLNWSKNGKTYFFSEDRFWRYNETSKTMDEDYPKHMERWRGVPTNLDAATNYAGDTYFFKGKYYWRFDNDWIIVTDTSPLPTPQTWLGCPKEEDDEYYYS